MRRMTDIQAPMRTRPHVEPEVSPLRRAAPDEYCPNQGDQVVRKLE